MTRRLVALVAAFVFLAGCGKIIDRIRGRHPEETELEDDEESDAACPREVHPGYCRRRCKSFAERRASAHAARVATPSTHAFGTCGGYDVFAERGPDGRGIIEYFEPDDGDLVAATDDRKTCGTYGPVPTCAAVLTWSK